MDNRSDYNDHHHSHAHQLTMSPSKISNGRNPSSKKKEIYRFEADWRIFASSWSTKPSSIFKLAIASFIEEYSNKIQLVQLEDSASELKPTIQFNHPYPPTKISYIPDSNNCHPELLATSADFLRVWHIPNTNDLEQDNSLGCKDQQKSVELKRLLNGNKDSSYCAPITSFDWNDVEPNLLVSSSIDTTCTIWNLELGKVTHQISANNSSNSTISLNSSGRVETQLIAHDREVYDVAFSRCGSGRDSFATAGGDGSVRMFDLRNLKHFITLYENQGGINGNTGQPMVRLACNKENPNYIATLSIDSKEVIILDIRKPKLSTACILNHSANVNSFAWAPYSACHLSTASDSNQALIWDLISLPNPVKDPILAYQAQDKVNKIDWSAAHQDWISICYGNTLEILRV